MVSNPASVPGPEFAAWYAEAKQMAIAQGIEVSELDWLLPHWTDLDRLSLRLADFARRPEIKLSQPWAEIKGAWQRRLTEQCPVQYLLGHTPWRNFHIQVDPAVLIPRPETELIIDIVQRQSYHPRNTDHWVDLGTGSGVLALGLATLFPQAIIHGVDQSASALAIARKNAQLNHLGDRLHWHQGDWWHPLTHLAGQIQGMVANPPYIPQGELSQLAPEVIAHEPITALDGGPDGLDCLRHLSRRSPLYIKPGGFWIVEIMLGQAQPVAALLRQEGSYEAIQIHPDLSGRERFVSARLRSPP